MKPLVSVFVAVLFASSASLSAQCPLADLSPSDGQAGDEFGASLALDGDWLVVGAPNADRAGVDRGAVYVYQRDGAGSWVEVQVLESSDPSDFDRFGWSVALEDDLLVVGVLSDDDLGFDSGSAYVFRFDGEDWVENEKLLASNGNLGDLFGISLALSDGRLVVGACQRSLFELLGVGMGMVYVFEEVAGTFVESDVLLASDRQDGDFFGAGVAMDGTRIVVGAEAEDQAATDAGALYVFDELGGSWTERAKLVVGDAGVGDFLGMRVRVDGDRIAAGAPTADVSGAVDAGAAYLFEDGGDGQSWTEVLKVVDASPGAGDQLGMGLDLRDELLAVGAPFAGASDAGRALLLRDDGAGYVAVVTLDGALTNDAYGWSAALDGDHWVVGAQAGLGSGSAHEVLHVAATSTTRNAGSNPDSLTMPPPVLGATIVATVDLAGTTGHPVVGLLGYASGATLSLPGGQVLLVDPTDPLGELLGAPVAGGSTATFTLPVPAETALCGSTLSLQALHFGAAPFALSNAIDCIVGS